MNSQDEKLLDDIGWHLLEELQADARTSYAELGRRVGLSTPAVMERVHKMEKAGIITGYRAEVNPEKVGFQVTAFIRIGL
ncbi:MAG: Lrp/AsnC family transcriptional regulator, partial [Acidobacteria bacterium]|nr:Lrp/AsnC family transcriptional regulator [Acidobacteriota bacterium]